VEKDLQLYFGISDRSPGFRQERRLVTSLKNRVESSCCRCTDGTYIHKCILQSKYSHQVISCLFLSFF